MCIRDRNITSLGTLSALTISGDLTVDTSTLKVDSSNNRVGIGVATPAAPLDVMVAGANQVYIRNSDNSAQNNAIVSLRSGGYSNIALDGATVDLKIGGSSKVHVDANGKVGIGTGASTVTHNLTVYGSGTAGSVFRRSSDAGQVMQFQFGASAAGNITVQSGGLGFGGGTTENKLFILEANPRASRTVPFIAKAYKEPYVNYATKVMLSHIHI